MAADPTAPYIEAFQRRADRVEPRWLRERRQRAIERFARLGFPTLKQEEWKYTNVAPLTRTSFTTSIPTDPAPIPQAVLDALYVRHTATDQLVFVDGHHIPALSPRGPSPRGMRVESLAWTLEHTPEALEPHLGHDGTFDDHPFAALNDAFFTDGAYIHVPRGITATPLVHLLFLATGQGSRAAFPRNLIVAEAGSHLSVLETFVSLGAGPSFTDVSTHLWVGDGAAVNHYKMQAESEAAFHVATTEGVQARGSFLGDHQIALGGALSRNDVRARFEGEGAELAMNGLYVLRGGQHTDFHTRIDHAVPQCTSLEYYRGILDGRSRGIFNGKVFVREGAQKTVARQTNKNLLLSEEALVDSTPSLEIRADDVKCNHGSSIGQLDEEALFYLRSRGMDEARARSVLTHAFAVDILAAVKLAPLRSRLHEVVLGHLPGGDALRDAVAV